MVLSYQVVSLSSSLPPALELATAPEARRLGPNLGPTAQAGSFLDHLTSFFLREAASEKRLWPSGGAAFMISFISLTIGSCCPWTFSGGGPCAGSGWPWPAWPLRPRPWTTRHSIGPQRHCCCCATGALGKTPAHACYSPFWVGSLGPKHELGCSQ